MRETIDKFLKAEKIGLVGASRDPAKFGSMILKELGAKGKEVFPVHPEAREIGGRPCVKSPAELPPEVDSLIVSVKAAAVPALIEGLDARRIKRIWLLRGASSPEAVAAAERKGLEIVKGQCPLMYFGPVDGPHAVHRFFKRLFGGMPK